jgi:ankyrin repeat protein
MPDTRGLAPLHWAARHGCDDAVRGLVKAGADLHLRDNQGQLALHWAAAAGHVDTAKLLIAAMLVRRVLCCVC